MTRNNSFKIKLFIACCFIHQANYWIDANKKVHCIYCLFVHTVFMMSTYRPDPTKMCSPFIVFQSTRLSKWLRLRKRENENNYGTVIVSAVSIAICFQDQEHLVCLLGLPFICCQVLVSRVSCDDTRSENFQTTYSRNVSINQGRVLQIAFHSP